MVVIKFLFLMSRNIAKRINLARLEPANRRVSWWTISKSVGGGRSAAARDDQVGQYFSIGAQSPLDTGR